MPRKRRFFLAGVPVHVVQRGNNRQAVFFDDSDYRMYLDWLLDPRLCVDEQSCPCADDAPRGRGDQRDPAGARQAVRALHQPPLSAQRNAVGVGQRGQSRLCYRSCLASLRPS